MPAPEALAEDPRVRPNASNSPIRSNQERCPCQVTE
jgi:hypothetical protein